VWNGVWAAATLALAAWAGHRAVTGGEAMAVPALVLHLEAALLFLVRAPARRFAPRRRAHGVALASAAYPFLYLFPAQIAPGLAQSIGHGLMVFGAVLVFLAAASLGRCFGVLPAVRGVRLGGLYRLVRHPLYAAYIVMDLGLVLAWPHPWNAALWGIGTALFVWRAAEEERLLSEMADYRAYRRAVPWRLLPGLY